jgi:SAM-dependent methyltransferase
MTPSADVVDFYEREGLSSQRYSSTRFWEQRYHTTRQAIVEDLLRQEVDPTTRFADVGCGSGEYLRFAKGLTSRVFGLDVSMNYLRRSHCRDGPNLIRGDVRRTPFVDRAFDVVLLSEVLEHVREQDVLIQELFRLSSRSILISTPNDGLIRRISRRVSRSLVERTDASVGHVAILSFDALLSKMTAEGWDTRTAYSTHVFPPTLDEIHLPRFLSPLLGALEHMLNAMLPKLGTVSIVLATRSQPFESRPATRDIHWEEQSK